MIHICILIYICTWYRTICCAKYVRFQNSFGHWSSAEVIESLRNAFGLSKWRWWDFNKLKVPHCTLLHCDWWGESHISALWIAIFPEIWQFWTSRIPYRIKWMVQGVPIDAFHIKRKKIFKMFTKVSTHLPFFGRCFLFFYTVMMLSQRPSRGSWNLGSKCIGLD